MKPIKLSDKEREIVAQEIEKVFDDFELKKLSGRTLLIDKLKEGLEPIIESLLAKKVDEALIDSWLRQETCKHIIEPTYIKVGRKCYSQCEKCGKTIRLNKVFESSELLNI